MDLKWSKYPDILSERDKNVKNRGKMSKIANLPRFWAFSYKLAWHLTWFSRPTENFCEIFFFEISKNSKKKFQKIFNFFFFSREIEDEDERLRVYQLDRLKYYYAVCETDSPETADEIYKEFDGQDYGDSGVNGKI